jgi:trimeric autotransporter adhesin
MSFKFNALNGRFDIVSSGGGGSGVSSLNSLVGNLTLVGGTNITITPSGSNITIASTAASDAFTIIQTDLGTYPTATTATSTLTLTSSDLSITGNSGSNTVTYVLNTVPINKGGTGQTTANSALNALLPSQATHSGQFLTTDGTNTSWMAGNSGTVTSVAQTTNTVSGLTVSGSPITTSGTLALTLGQATTSTNGYLSSTDWNTFNNK